MALRCTLWNCPLSLDDAACLLPPTPETAEKVQRMTHRKTAAWALAALAASLLGLAPGNSAAQMADAEAAPIRIGMAQTMFIDVPQPFIDILTHPFGAMMKKFTGIEGKLIVGGDPLTVARKLNDKALDLAVFQGVEFAQVRGKFDALEPLMVAVYHHKKLHAHLVVCKDCQANSVADLKNKDVAIPKKSKEHCRLFLEKHCAECGEQNPRAFFGQVCNPANPEEALDDVLSGKYQAAVIDRSALDYYEYLKPGAFSQLKSLKISEPFPPAVIVYRKGALEQAKLDIFRKGLLDAAKNEQSRELMRLMRITSFDPVPEDFAQNLADILRVYPAPRE